MKTNWIVVATLLMILALMNHAIWQKQQHLSQGEEVILKLTPVDPRSMMQGDYMTLDFEVGQQIRRALFTKMGRTEEDFSFTRLAAQDGYVVVEQDESGVHQYVGLFKGQPLGPGQRRLQFRARDYDVKFATNAYFFPEGQEPIFRNARYGLFKLNDKGEVLLTNLLDEDLTIIAVSKGS